MNLKNSTPEFYSVKEVINVYGVTRQTLANWRKKGILVPYKIGRKVLYRTEDVYNNLKKQVSYEY